MTTRNPLLVLKSLGQSIWLDYIERGMLANGELAHLIDRDGLAGITSNPAIFEKAIDGTPGLRGGHRRSLARRGRTTEQFTNHRDRGYRARRGSVSAGV